MSRQTDALALATAQQLAAIAPVSGSLPAIDWARIGHSAPQPIAVPARVSTDPLPKADVVIITWTNAEWSALDHVFVNSASSRGPQTHPGSWRTAWLPYTRNVGNYTSDQGADPLWGYFRVVTMAGSSGPLTVLLFHSNAHLQYQPYIAGLRAMVTDIIKDTQPKQLYSIGTAGGGTLNQELGDAVVTNSAQLLPGVAPNDTDPANGKTFTCSTWYPSTSLFAAAQSLMFPLSEVVTSAELQTLFGQLKSKISVGAVALSDLVNGPLDPKNLSAPTTHSMKGVPLNTSCNYGMAPGSGSTQYSAYEEDDAAVGQAAQTCGVNFAFIRNVSDSVVPDHTAGGVVIPFNLRKSWAGILYDRYGWITASNGALATWAAVAAS
jgi:nucleoside phosphorylase